MSFLEKYLDTLKANGILGEMSPNEFYKLERDIKRMQTRVSAEVLAKVEGAMVDMRERHSSTADDYVRLLDAMQALTKDALHYSNIEFRSADKSKRFYSHDMHFKLNDVPVHCEITVREDKPLSCGAVIRAMNWGLVENGREERFHEVSIRDDEGNVQQFGIIYLTPDQRKTVVEQGLALLSRFNELAIYSQKTIDNWITQFRNAGLFEHIDKNKLENTIANISPYDIYSAVSILWKIPDVMVTFDSELTGGNLSQEIDDILTSAFVHVDSTITVSDITAEKHSGEGYQSIEVSLTANGQRYDASLEDMGGWLDVRSLMTVVNKILTEMGHHKQFYGVDGGDQGVIIVAITSEHMQALTTSTTLDIRPF